MAQVSCAYHRGGAITKSNIVACEGSGYYAKDIEEGYALCPYCKEVRAVRSDGSLRNHRGKKVFRAKNEVPEPVVDPVVIDLKAEEPPPEDIVVREPRPSYIVSLVEDVAIGWDSCGKCLMHIKVCECKEPTRPAYIGKLIAEAEKRKANG